MPQSGLSLGVPPSSPAWGSSDQSPQHQRIHKGELIEGCSGILLSGGDAHSVWLCYLANIVISRGHSSWCPAYVQLHQALIKHHRSDSVAGQPTNNLTSPHVDLWGWGRDTEWALGVAGGGGYQEQCLWGQHRWWDSQKKKEKKLLW